MILEEAEKICQDLIMGSGMLATHFYQWTVCGSIRRRKPTVNDIDIVAIPKSDYEPKEIPLSEHIALLDPTGEMEAKEDYKHRAARFLDGEAIKRFKYKGLMVDIYLATVDSFETLKLIRTGSEKHNIKLTTIAKSKGLRLFASGKGLCTYKTEKGKAIPVEIVEKTEDGILSFLLGHIPRPEERD